MSDFISPQIINSLRDRLSCPISLQVMEDPLQCPLCGKSFEAAQLSEHLARNNHCPTCQKSISIDRCVKNRTLNEVREEIESWLNHPQHSVEAAEPPAPPRTPLTVAVIGKSGVGKSELLNQLVGHVVAESRQDADSVTQIPQVVYIGPIGECNYALIDAPGLFDRNKTNKEILVQLSALLQQEIHGFDTIFHVIRHGRLADADSEVAELVLAGLSTTEEERQQVAMRYKFVISHANTSRYRNEAEQQQAFQRFRMDVAYAMPNSLRNAAENAIFIENDDRLQQGQFSVESLRSQVLGAVIACREINGSLYVPPLLSEVLNRSQDSLKQIFAQFSLSKCVKLSYEELLSLRTFFHYISKSNRWMEPRSTDCLPVAFEQEWNNLNLVARNEIAVTLAREVLDKVAEATRTAFQEQQSKAIKQVSDKMSKEMREVRRKLDDVKRSAKSAEEKADYYQKEWQKEKDKKSSCVIS
jgi:GTPase SAR1 family protein